MKSKVAVASRSWQRPIPAVAGELRIRATLRAVLIVLGGLLLCSAAGQVRIPVPGTDVPATLQSLAILVVALVLPRACSVAIAVTYVLGVTAAPMVFAPGSLGLLGPTGGYLVGFVLAAWTTGTLCGALPAGIGRMAFAAAAGTAVIFTCGVAWRSLWAWVVGVEPMVAAVSGLIPFLGIAAIKLALAVLVAHLVLRGTGPRNPWCGDRDVCSGVR